jgi:hypothetical protein
MNSMVFDGFEGMGVWLSNGVPSINNMLGLSWAMCWRGMCIVLTVLRIVMPWG